MVAPGWTRRIVVVATALSALAMPVVTPPTAVALGPGRVIDVAVAGRGGVPADGVGAVVLNLTATDVESETFATVYPAGSPRPDASNVNVAADDTVANMVLVPLGADGAVSIYQYSGPSEMVVDVNGWFAADSPVHAVPPSRIMDTRDGRAPLGAADRLRVPAAGHGAVPADGASAVVVNLTAVNATAETVLTAWPGDTALPTASNLNPVPGHATANLAVVPLAADGSFTVANLAGSVDVVVDVLGWLPVVAPGVVVREPVRVLDTRVDHRPVGARGTLRVPVPPDAIGASGLLVNLTVTGATTATYLAVSGSPTSLLNTLPARTIANLVVLPIGRLDGDLLVNYAGTVDVVADVLGWFGPGSGYTALEPSRLLDTRVAHVIPVSPGTNVGWPQGHHDYPATDIFAACGSIAVSPVTGVVVHVRRNDFYVRSIDNPALRGGRSVAVLGDDGVRYYMAHFASVDAATVPGERVVAGQRIAVVGRSGDAGACHIHFGLSPNCPQLEYSVRRGVIWPYPYLDQWRAGRNRSPAPAIEAWSAANPSACANAAADPYASGAG